MQTDSSFIGRIFISSKGMITKTNVYVADWVKYLTVPGSMPGLDLLRAIAIIMVVIWHRNNGFQIGWTGVDLFFVLSGFLVGGSILTALSKNAFMPAAYFRARFWRIYPLYIASIVAFITVSVLQKRMSIEDVAGTFFLHAFFIQTISPYFAPTMTVHLYDVTWSLVVEVYFYLVLPLFVISLYYRGTRWIFYGLLIIVASYPFVRALLASPYMSDDYNWHYFLFLRPHYRLDELFYGVLAAVVAHSFGKSFVTKWSNWLLVAGLAAVAAVYLHVLTGISNPLSKPVMALLTRDSIIIPSALALGFALILLWSLRLNWAPIAVVIIARLAYPIYLTHNLVRAMDVGLVEYYVIGGVVAVMASIIIEYPFIRMYKTKPKAPSQTISAAA